MALRGLPGTGEPQSVQVERALEPSEGGRSYFREKYLLIVLDGGRRGISDRTLDPDLGGKLIAAGMASNSLDEWLQRNIK